MADNAPTQQQMPELIRSDKFVSIYANSTILDVTPWDFRFSFGVWIKPETGKLPKVENLVEVIMSPQHAKAFFGLLQSHVEQYEKQIGEIKLPQPIGPLPENPATKH